MVEAAKAFKKRLGKFSIGRNFIYNNPRLVKRIMGECIVVSAIMKWHTDAIHYVALSDWFDVVPNDGSELKIYRIEFYKDKHNITKWMFY